MCLVAIGTGWLLLEVGPKVRHGAPHGGYGVRAGDQACSGGGGIFHLESLRRPTWRRLWAAHNSLMEKIEARIVWDDELNFHIEPDLSAADTLRFMIESPEYHAAQELWRARNKAAGTFERDDGTAYVLRPEGTVLDDVRNGGPVPPKRH